MFLPSEEDGGGLRRELRNATRKIPVANKDSASAVALGSKRGLTPVWGWRERKEEARIECRRRRREKQERGGGPFLSPPPSWRTKERRPKARSEEEEEEEPAACISRS